MFSDKWTYVKDKWTGKRQNIGLFWIKNRVKDNISDIKDDLLSLCVAVGGGCHAVFGPEIPGESVGFGEAAGLTNLLNA